MKSHLRYVIPCLLCSVLVTAAASAQWNVARFESEPNRIYMTFGLDPAFLPTVGYGRVVSVFGHRFQLAGDAGVVAAKLDTRDFRVRLQAFTSILNWRSLHLTGGAMFITRGTDNSVYRGFNFGADITGTLGVYRSGWFLAGEFGFDKATVTHVTHSDWYRTYFYPEAKDGWYLDAGGRYHYGLTGGFTLGRGEVVLRYGMLRTQGGNELTPPVYASVGFGVAF